MKKNSKNWKNKGRWNFDKGKGQGKHIDSWIRNGDGKGCSKKYKSNFCITIS